MAVSDNEIRMILKAQDDTSAALKQVAENLEGVRQSFDKAAEAADKYRQTQDKAKGGTDWLKTVNRITNETASTMYSLQGATNNVTSAIAALGQIGTQGIRAVFNAMISATQAAQNFITAFQQINAIVGTLVNTVAPGLGTIITLVGNFGAIAAQAFLIMQQVSLAVWREIFTAGVNALTGLASLAVSAAGAIGSGFMAGLGALFGLLQSAGKSVGGFVANLLNVGPAFEAATNPGTAFGAMLKDNVIAGAAFAVGMAAAKVVMDGFHSTLEFIGKSFIDFNALIERSTIGFAASFAGVGVSAEMAEGKARGFLGALQDLAARSPAEFGGLLKAAQGFIGMGVSAEQTLPILKNVVGVMALAGRSGADLQGIAKGLQDIAAKGRVGAQDMRQLAEHGIPAWQYLAIAAKESGAYGVEAGDSIAQAIGKIRKASEAGLVPAAELFQALDKAAKTDKVVAAMEALEKSWDVVTSNIGDRGNMLVHSMTQPIFAALARLLKGFSDFLASPMIVEFAERVGATFSALIDMLEPAVKAIGDAFQNIASAFQSGGVTAALDQAKSEFMSFGKSLFGAGWEAISQFAAGILGGANQLLNDAASGAAQIIADYLVGHSPPPKGPLKTIDEDGRRIVLEYLKGMASAPIEELLGEVPARIKRGLTGTSPGEQRKPSFTSLEGAETAIADIEKKQKPVRKDVEDLQHIYEDIGGVVSGIKDRIGEVRQAQDDVSFVIKDVKADYETQINQLERQLSIIQNQNKAYYELMTISDRLNQIDIDRQRLAMMGDPGKRAEIEGQLELLNSQAKTLSLEEKMLSIEDQRTKAAKEMADWRRASEEFERGAFANNLRGKVTRGVAPEKPDEKKFDLAQKRLNIELQIARLELSKDKLGDKVGLAQLKVREAIAQHQATINRLASEENDLRNRMQAIPIEEKIRNTKDAMEDALKPLEDYKRSLDRQLDVLQQAEGAWKRLEKSTKDLLDTLKEIVTADELSAEGFSSLGKKWAANLLTGFQQWWKDNFSSIIGGLIGSQIGGMLFGPLGAVAGGLFGSKFGAALGDKLPNWPELLMGKIQGSLEWLQTNLTAIGQSFGTWGQGASAGSAAIGNALEGVGGIVGAVALALKGDIPGAINLAIESFGKLGTAIALAVVEVGKWLNLDLSPGDNIFLNMAAIVMQAYKLITDTITGAITTVAGWLNIPFDDSTSNWALMGQIITTVVTTVVGWIQEGIKWIDELIGRNPAEAAGSTWSQIVDIWNGIKDAIGTAVTTIIGWFDKLINYDTTSGKTRWESITQTFTDLWTWVDKVTTRVLELAAQITGAEVGTDKWTTIQNIFEQVWVWGKKIVDFVSEFGKVVASPETIGLAIKIFDNLNDIISQIAKAFGLMPEQVGPVGEGLSQAGSSGKSFGEALQMILGGIKNVLGFTATFIDFFNTVADGFNTIMEAGLMINKVFKGQASWGDVGKVFAKIPEQWKGYLDRGHARMADGADGMKTIAEDGVKKAADGAEKAAKANPITAPAPESGATAKSWETVAKEAEDGARAASERANAAAAQVKSPTSTTVVAGDPTAAIAAAEAICSANMALAECYANLASAATTHTAQLVAVTVRASGEAGDAIMGLSRALESGITMMSNLDPQGVDGSISRIANTIWQHSQEFADTGATLGVTLVAGIQQAIDDNFPSLVVTGAVARLLEALWNLAADKFCPTGEEAGRHWTKCLADSIDNNGQTLVIDGAVARLLNALWNLAASNFAPTGKEAGDAYMLAMMKAIDDRIQDIVGAVQRALYAVSQLAPNFAETGTNLGVAFIIALRDAIDLQLDEITGAIDRLLYQLFQMKDKFQSTGQTAGDAFMMGLMIALEEGLVQSYQAGNYIGEALLAGLLNHVNGAYDAGRNTGAGYGEGINASSPGAIANAGRLGKNSIDNINRAIDAHSPSKAAIEAGRNVALGFAAGINADAEVARNIGIIVREALDANVDPAIALALAKVESGFKADAVGDNGHSVGLFQLHDRGAGAGMTTAQRADPTTNARTFFQQEAKHFQDAVRDGFKGADLAREFGRRAERPLAGTEGKYATSYQDVMRTASANMTMPAGGGAARGAAAPNVRGSTLPRGFQIVSQFDLPGLSAADAAAACGPAAAIAFARAVGRNPTSQEAMAIASKIGWTERYGMGGAGNFQDLAQQLGAQTQKLPATQQNIDAALAAGRPFAVSTTDPETGHYYQVAGGQQGAGGKLNVGATGTMFRRGSAQMSLDEIESVSGKADSIIVLLGEVGDKAAVAANTAATSFAGAATAQGRSLAEISGGFRGLVGQYGNVTRSSAEMGEMIRTQGPQVVAQSQSLISSLLGTSNAANTANTSIANVGSTVASTRSPMQAFVDSVAGLRPQVEAGAVAGQLLQEQIIKLADSTKMAQSPMRGLETGILTSEEAIVQIIEKSKGLSTDFMALWENVKKGKLSVQDATNQFFNLMAAFKDTPAAAKTAADAITAAGDASNRAFDPSRRPVMDFSDPSIFHPPAFGPAAGAASASGQNANGTSPRGMPGQAGATASVATLDATTLTAIGSQLQATAASLVAALESIKATLEAMQAGVEKGVSDITNAISQMSNAVTNAIYAAAGKSAAGAAPDTGGMQGVGSDPLFLRGMPEGAGPDVTGIAQMAAEVQNASEAYNSSMGAMNDQWVRLGEATNASVDVISEAVTRMAHDIYTATDAAGQAAHDLAVAIADGMSQGLLQMSEAADLARDMTDSVFMAIEDEAEISSPSRRGMEVGEAIANGMGIALEERIPQLEAIAREVTSRFVGAAMNSVQIGQINWGFEKKILELGVERAKEEARLIPLRMEILDLTREIEKIERGSLSDQLRLVQIEGRRMQIELAQIQAKRQLQKEFGAEQDRIQKRELELNAAIAQSELERVPIEIAIKNLQEDIADVQRGSIDDQLKVFDLETARLGISYQIAEAQQRIRAEFSDILGMEQRLAKLAVERAKADLAILPARQALAAVDRNIENIRRGSLQEQIADIRRDEQRTKLKLRQMDIEKELQKLRKSELLEGEALFEANTKRFGLNDYTTSMTGERIGALERELGTMEDQNAELDRQEETQRLLRELAVISDRIQKATIEDTIKQHEELTQSLLNEIELLEAQKAVREAEKALMEAEVIGPLQQRLDMIGGEIDLIGQRNDLSSRGMERELILLENRLRIMERSARPLEDELTLLNAQKGALDALIALREYQITGPLERELQMLNDEAKIIELTNKLMAQPSRERLIVLQEEERLQSKQLQDLEDQLDVLGKQKSVWEAIAALISGIADATAIEKKEEEARLKREEEEKKKKEEEARKKEEENRRQAGGSGSSGGVYTPPVASRPGTGGSTTGPATFVAQINIQALNAAYRDAATVAHPVNFVSQVDVNPLITAYLEAATNPHPVQFLSQVDVSKLIAIYTEAVNVQHPVMFSPFIDALALEAAFQEAAAIAHPISFVATVNVDPLIEAYLEAAMVEHPIWFVSTINVDTLIEAYLEAAMTSHPVWFVSIINVDTLIEAYLEASMTPHPVWFVSNINVDTLIEAYLEASMTPHPVWFVSNINVDTLIEAYLEASNTPHPAWFVSNINVDTLIEAYLEAANSSHPVWFVSSINVDTLIEAYLEAAMTEHPAQFVTRVDRTDLDATYAEAEKMHIVNFDDWVQMDTLEETYAEAKLMHIVNFDDWVQTDTLDEAYADALRMHIVNFDDWVQTDTLAAAYAEALNMHRVNFNLVIEGNTLRDLYHEASTYHPVRLTAELNRGNVDSQIDQMTRPRTIQVNYQVNGSVPRAKGGDVSPSGMYTVGERGPELFVPQTRGVILPTQMTKKILSSLPGRANGGMVEPWQGGGGGGGSRILDLAQQMVSSFQMIGSIVNSVVADMIDGFASASREVTLVGEGIRYVAAQQSSVITFGGPNSVIANNPTGRTATPQEGRTTNLSVTYNYYGSRQISGQSELETVVRDAVRYSESMG